MQAPVSIIQDLTTEIIPAKGDLPAICFAAPNPEESYPPPYIALFFCITGQDRSEDNRQGGECESVPLSSLVRRGYVAALRFERFLLVRLPRLQGLAGSLSRRFRIFLERAFVISSRCKTAYEGGFCASSKRVSQTSNSRR